MKERSIPTSPIVPQTRPKLELKKRSEGLPEPTPTVVAETPTTKSNPFGAAKPIDAEARLREVEEKRAALKREQDEKAKKEAEERQANEEVERLAKVEEPEKAEIPEAENTEKPAKPERTFPSPRESREPREHREFGRGGYKGDRTDRNDRGDRYDKVDRNDRSDRHDKIDRNDRGDRHDKMDRNDRSDRGHDRFERGGGGAGQGNNRPFSGGGREWRRAPDHPPSQGRRESRQETKPQSTTAAEPAKVEPVEDGWSTVPTRKGRGGSKVATMT